MSDKILKVNKLTKNYNNNNNVTEVLHDVNFEILKQEFVAIMGPSGSGKTTLLNLLATIDKPSSGSIILDNIDISNLSDKNLTEIRQNKMGFIFQDYNLLDTLTIKENILLPLAIKKVKVDIIEQKVLQIASDLQITTILDKYPYQVSGGQKQRCAIARAVITEPSIIYADEPTGALDSKTALNLLETLAKLNTKASASILMVTHDAFAASFCTRVLFIKDGQIFTQLNKAHKSQKEFFEQILEAVTTLGGN